MTYDKSIIIERQDEETENWTPIGVKPFHANVNKHLGSTTDRAGADQFRAQLRFKLRYVPILSDIQYTPQLYRIIYRGKTFRIVDYDDFQEQHLEITLTGALYE